MEDRRWRIEDGGWRIEEVTCRMVFFDPRSSSGFIDWT